MSVIVAKNKKTAVIVCGGPCVAKGLGCGAKSKAYPVSSPAAPELSASEASEKDGWTFDCGFWAMALGHTNLCPECTKRAREEKV